MKSYNKKMSYYSVPDKYYNEKFTWDFGMKEAMEICKPRHSVIINNYCMSRRMINNKKSCILDIIRPIEVNITSFCGTCSAARHIYCKIRLSSLGESDGKYSSTLRGEFNDIEFQLWTLSDKELLKETVREMNIKKLDENDYYSSRICSIEDFVNGFCEFINDNFEKLNFIFCINDLTDYLTDENVREIEYRTAIRSIKK